MVENCCCIAGGMSLSGHRVDERVNTAKCKQYNKNIKTGESLLARVYACELN